MEFLKGAKDFTRNPLGIIALFISLIYGFASFLLGTSAEKLESAERWPIILFIVIFPFVVLLVFYKLVTKHHVKLYSPSDFKTDDSFLQAMSEKEKEQKLEESIVEITGESFNSSNEIQKIQKRDIRSKLLESESYVVNYFEKKLGIKPENDVKIGPDKYAFDSSFIAPGKQAILLEVKYYSRPTIIFSTIYEFIYRAKLTSEFMTIDTRFILAIVIDGDSEHFNKIKETWELAISETDLNVQFKVFKTADIFS